MGKKKQEEHVIKEATVDTDLWRTAMFGMNDSLRKIVEDASAGSDESGVVFDINAKDASGATPLIYAARAGHVETIQYLVDNGGDVLVRLIEKNADVNAATKTGTVPLHVAAQTGGDAIAAKLIERRARAGSGASPAFGTSDRVGTSDRAARPGRTRDERRMHILLLVANFPWFYGAYTDQGWKLANGLVDLGHDVTWCTWMFHHPGYHDDHAAAAKAAGKAADARGAPSANRALALGLAKEVTVTTIPHAVEPPPSFTPVNDVAARAQGAHAADASSR
ncbi:hypothetical protein JL721_6117 [Aureococcus anophagefferens]|nr:hypothetical protein JL721_6117 [Aureococcus anophagefferens]